MLVTVNFLSVVVNAVRVDLVILIVLKAFVVIDLNIICRTNWLLPLKSPILLSQKFRQPRRLAPKCLYQAASHWIAVASSGLLQEQI
jgi:hypothetical protein